VERGGRGWESLFWLSTGALDGGGRESSSEAARRGVAFAPVAAVAAVLVGAAQLTRVLLLPSAAFCRLVGLPFLLPPILWSTLKNRIYFATNTSPATIAACLVILFVGLVTLPTVCIRTGGGAKVIGLFRYLSLVRYFYFFTIRQSTLNAVYVPP